MAIAVVAFVVLRAAVVPRTFGQYGHYRGAAIAEAASRPLAFAGHDTCETCHTDVVDQKKQGKHVVVPCEACHGAQARHADDPASVKPPKLDTALVCSRCHEANSAKPKAFPRWPPQSTQQASPATPAISPTAPKLTPRLRPSLQRRARNNGRHPPPFTHAIARCRCRLEVRSSRHPRGLPQLQTHRALVGHVDRYSQVHWLRQLRPRLRRRKRRPRGLLPHLA